MTAKIPTCLNDVNKEWLQDALKSSNEPIEVIEISPVEEKIGFLSGTNKAKVKIGSEIKNLFIKSIANPDDPCRALFYDVNLDEVEIKFYKEYLVALIDFTKEKSKLDVADELENMAPKLYSSGYCLEKENRGFYLIMDDISSQYSMKTGPEGTDQITIITET